MKHRTKKEIDLLILERDTGIQLQIYVAGRRLVLIFAPFNFHWGFHGLGGGFALGPFHIYYSADYLVLRDHPGYTEVEE